MTTKRMTPADYADLGIPVPEHMRGPWDGTLSDLVGRSFKGRVITQEILEPALPDRCEGCGASDQEEGPLCVSCSCCSTCCNCTPTDCDCDPCHDRRSFSDD